ncbi:MAG: Rpn family recombination-promoting nuclease/putative transposase [Acetatifactor sp.]
MGQKDLTQKNLESFPDVFADIVNALLYEGKQVLEPDKLQSAPTETIYLGKKGCLRNQFHDVSKYEMQGEAIKLQYTIENEINPNQGLILRKMGYEGAVYREQWDRKTGVIYPVISLVLYWGKNRKRIKGSIRALFKKELPEEIMQYIDDAKLFFYDMRRLPGEVRERFQSDMRIVVDYLAEGKDYQPTRQSIVHLKEFLRLMKEISGDVRYEEILSHLENNQNFEQGGLTMCELLDKYENRGIQKGIQKGMQKGIKALVETCQEFGLTQAETAGRIIQKFSISQDESMRCTQKYWGVSR